MLVIALLVVMVIVVALQAIGRGPNDARAFNERCVAAGGHVVNPGNGNGNDKLVCRADDDTDITLP
jgi:hypothetical protein